MQGSEQGPANLRRRKALGLKYLVVAKVEISKHILTYKPTWGGLTECFVWMHQILLCFLPRFDKSLNCCVPIPGVRALICSEQPHLGPPPTFLLMCPGIPHQVNLEPSVLSDAMGVAHPPPQPLPCLCLLMDPADSGPENQELRENGVPLPAEDGSKGRDSKTCSVSVLVSN